MKKNYHNINGQQGIALLMAIVIVAFVVIISVSMITQRQLQIYRTANIYNKEQAWQYALASERWAISVLSQDYKNEIKTTQVSDGYQDVWNQSLENLNKIKVEGSIKDLQGRFNLNNLFYKNKVQTQWLKAYRQLLINFKLPASLADSLVDWIDSDSSTFGSDGAEDEYYLSLRPAYRPSNTYLVQLSELLLIKGYNQDIIDTLKPYVYVVADRTAVNINTADKQVLKAVMNSISEKQIIAIVEQQKKKSFQSMDELIKSDFMKNSSIDKNLLSVSSGYFMVSSKAQVNGYQIMLNSLLKRDGRGEIAIISRREIPLYE